MKFSVEQWAVEYGTPMGPDALAESEATIDITCEVAADQWVPMSPPPGTPVPHDLAFVDGVRRVEGRVWVTDGAGDMHQGICASYAAGVVHCNGAATVVQAVVDRGLFCDGPDLEAITTRHGRFGVKAVGSSGSPDALTLALQGAMASLEQHVSEPLSEDCLLIVDGPLRDRRSKNTVGYVKTHHVAYLPEVVRHTVPALAPGQRTPLFLLGDRFRRWSWYVRLPGDLSHGWAGVVRCEADPDLELDAAVLLAHQVTGALQRFASEAHKDPRAPQNLYPIAGLERELRRRLGDPKLLYRALREAAVA